MTTVIFHWETPKGFDNPHARKKLLARWGLTCKAFGIYQLYCVTNEPLKISDTEIVFKVFISLEDAIKQTEGEVVYLEQGGESLSDYSHPENAVYVFGSDYGELEIDNAISINSKLPLHAEISAGIVLAHRYTQWH